MSTAGKLLGAHGRLWNDLQHFACSDHQGQMSAREPIYRIAGWFPARLLEQSALRSLSGFQNKSRCVLSLQLSRFRPCQRVSARSFLNVEPLSNRDSLSIPKGQAMKQRKCTGKAQEAGRKTFVEGVREQFSWIKIPFLSIIFVSCSDMIPFATLIRLGMIKIVII